ncbi:hypothetical protein MTBGP_11110 [Moorella thermoacetica]|uniref:hypothetical protein n=1 Tax=Neomoorella thermoacetica TaxID=1525 RepID=UPI0030D4B582
MTGVSSPWVEKYTILEQQEEPEGSWRFTVQFDLMTSTGLAGSYINHVTVQHKDYLPLLQAALQYDAANERVLFYTGVAYRLRNENEEAIKYFDQLAPRPSSGSLPDRVFHFPSDAYLRRLGWYLGN